MTGPTQAIEGFVAGILGAARPEPEQLLQHLIAVQQRFGYIPPAAVESLAATLDVTRTQVRAAIAFYSFLHDRRAAISTSCTRTISPTGCWATSAWWACSPSAWVRLDETRANGRVTVGLTACTGMCDQGPAMLVDGQAVTALTPQRVDRIADLVEQGVPLTRWPGEYFRVEDNIHRRGLLLSNPVTDGASLRKLIARGPDAALAEIEGSGLRGAARGSPRR